MFAACSCDRSDAPAKAAKGDSGTAAAAPARAEAPAGSAASPKSDASPDAGGLGALVDAARPPAPPPVPIAVTRGDVQLEGLYFQQRMWFFNGRSSLDRTFYYFFPDGHVYQGVPPGGTVHPNPTADDFAAIQKVDPKQCGSYEIRGGKITLQYAGQTPRSYSFSFEKPGDSRVAMIDGLGAVRVGAFKENQRLDARYEAGAIVSSAANSPGPHSTVASSNTLDFHPDGTFGEARIGSVSSAGDHAEIGGSSSSKGGGNYTLSGNTLILTTPDGKSQASTVYPYPDKDEFPPAHMGVGRAMFKLEKR